MTESTDPAISTADYRRQARRLRCRFAADPAQLQRSLLTLSRRRDHAPRTHTCEVRRVSPTQRFTSILCEQVNSSAGVLRYSQRLALLRAARSLGVGRFEANLLIAAVIERHRQDATSSQDTARSGSLVTMLTVVGLLQSAIALGAWWTFIR